MRTGPKCGIVAGDAVGEFVEIGFADEDGAGIFERGDDGGVFERKKIAKKFGAAGGAKAGGVEIVFQRDGDAVERAEVAAGLCGALWGKERIRMAAAAFQAISEFRAQISVEAGFRRAMRSEKKVLA